MTRRWPRIGPTPAIDKAHRPASLLRMLDGLLVAFVVFGVADLALFLAYRQPSMGYVVLLILALAVTAGFVRAAVVKGHVEAGIWTMSATIMGAAFVFVVLRPYLYPLLALGSLLVLAIAMPHLDRRRLTILAAAVWLASIVLLVVGSLLAPTATPQAPDWYATAIFIAAEAAVIALVLMAILHVGSSLKVTLDALAQTNRRLREVDTMKTQFMNTAAHELNTPLTPIKLQVHLLKHDTAGLSDDQRRSIDILDRNVQRVTELVRDVLDASRIQSGRLKLKAQPCDIGHLIDEAVASFRHPYEAAGLSLEVSYPQDMLVHADPRRVMQVLFNLLANAMKFTPAGGRVSVAAESHQGDIEVTVTDTGIGLEFMEAQRLFQPFSQIDRPQSLQAGGTGLGLYIARGIVEEHGGRIWVESPGHGRGSSFRFTLPAFDDGHRQAAERDGLTETRMPSPAPKRPLDERLRELI